MSPLQKFNNSLQHQQLNTSSAEALEVEQELAKVIKSSSRITPQVETKTGTLRSWPATSLMYSAL